MSDEDIAAVAAAAFLILTIEKKRDAIGLGRLLPAEEIII